MHVSLINKHFGFNDTRETDRFGANSHLFPPDTRKRYCTQIIIFNVPIPSNYCRRSKLWKLSHKIIYVRKHRAGN
jgi:hypothetical protein